MNNTKIRLYLAKIQRWSIDRTTKIRNGADCRINLEKQQEKRDILNLLTNAELAYDLVRNPDAATMVYIGAIRLSPCGLFADEIARKCELNRRL